MLKVKIQISIFHTCKFFTYANNNISFEIGGFFNLSDSYDLVIFRSIFLLLITCLPKKCMVPYAHYNNAYNYNF